MHFGGCDIRITFLGIGPSSCRVGSPPPSVASAKATADNVETSLHAIEAPHFPCSVRVSSHQPQRSGFDVASFVDLTIVVVVFTITHFGSRLAEVTAHIHQAVAVVVLAIALFGRRGARGIQGRDTEGLVEPSDNLATVKREETEIRVRLSARSAVAAALDSGPRDSNSSLDTP